MTLKSVIDIDLNDAAFKRFSELFEKYQAALAKTPNVWKAVSKEQAAIAEHFEKQTAALMAQSQVARENKDEDARRLNQLTTTEKLWQSMSRHSSSMLKNVLGISANTMGWIRGLGALGAVVGVGYEGYRKISDAATDVAGQRREARGLGTDIGTLAAFKTAFGRDVEPDFMDRMLEMETDVSRRTPWYALGLGKMSGNVSQDTLAMLNAERAFAQRQPLSQLGTMAQAYGLPSSTEELMRLRGTSDAEWQEQQRKFLEVQKGANITDANAKVAQDFATKMEAASKAVAAAWNRDMIKLMPRVADWASAAVKGVAATLDDPFGATAQALKNLREHPLFGTPAEVGTSVEGTATGLLDRGERATSSAWQWLAGKLGGLADLPPLPRGLLEAQMRAESDGNPNAVSPKGAQGLFQFMPGTAAELGINPFDPAEARQGAEVYDTWLLKKYGGDLREALAAYNAGTGAVDRLVSKWGGDWFSHASQETQNYVNKIVVQINNATGGSATASVSGLAAPSG